MRAFDDRTWLDPRIEVRPSSIEGCGLFAHAPIPAGTVVERWGGTVLTDDQLEAHKAGKYSAAAIGDGFNLLQDPHDPVVYGNHSCDPNLWMADDAAVSARRDIARGDELTIDYATHTIDPTWSMACRCESALCRRVIAGDDWLRADLRERYRDHFSPFINRRIADDRPPARPTDRCGGTSDMDQDHAKSPSPNVSARGTGKYGSRDGE